MVTNKRRVRVEWGHCDPAAIVFYPQYFAWFDACTSHLFESVGLHPKTFFREFGVMGFPLLEANAKFYIPSAHGDDMDVESGVVEWGAKTFKLSHRFTRGDALLLEGVETRIFVTAHPDDPKRMKSVPIPKEVKRLLRG